MPQIHTYSKQIVEAGQRFQEEVSTFVRELIPSSDEEEQTFIQIEVKVPEGQSKRRENRSHLQKCTKNISHLLIN